MKYLLTIIIQTVCFIAIGQQFSQITTGDLANETAANTGCSWSDFNNDGFPDLFIGTSNGDNQLWKNNGDGTFDKITSGNIVNDGGASYAGIWGDYDNDGNLDLYVSNNPLSTAAPESNFLYRNEGPPGYGFEKIMAQPFVNDTNYTWSSSWVDYDNDGDLDLHMPDNKHLRTDFFYENNGDGTFSSIQPPFVTPDVESTGTVSWIDFDHDGDQDLFMIKSGRTHPDNGEDNRMYINLLSENNSLEFKRIYTADMVNHFDLDFQASWGDYDNDGDMDVYLGNFDAPNYLYRNEGDSIFTQITEGPPVENNTATLGSTWGDFDNDGDLDLFVNNSIGQKCRYYQNDGNGNFTTLNSAEVGPPVSNISAAQSCANADFNNDGYLDLFVSNTLIQGIPNNKNFLYQNNGGNNNYFELTCTGTNSNTSAIGTKIWIKASINGQPTTQLRHITGSPTGDRGQNDLRVHFGLGDAQLIDSLIIQWPLGLTEIYTEIEVNQICGATESNGTSCSLISNTLEQLPLKKRLKISPNPSNGNSVKIEYSNVKWEENATIQLINMRGEIIKTWPLRKIGFSNIKIDGVSPGEYIISIKFKTEVITEKIFVIK